MRNVMIVVIVLMMSCQVSMLGSKKIVGAHKRMEKDAERGERGPSLQICEARSRTGRRIRLAPTRRWASHDGLVVVTHGP
jgi:hypothetical protein